MLNKFNRIKSIYIYSLIISIFVILLSIQHLSANNNNQNNQNKNDIHTINLENYIYEKLNLKNNEYKFKKANNNPYGNIIFAYTLYKAKGTLLININIPQNYIGYRVLEQVKEISDISIGYDNTVLLNTLAGKNKFYYLNPTGTLEFDSPSFNTSTISSFPTGFYWIGFKYSDPKTKKLENKNQYLFTYINQKINSYDISFINSKIKSKTFNIIVLNQDNIIIQEYNNFLSNIYLINLKTKNIKEIEKKQEIIIGNFIRNNFYYLKYNPQNQKLTIKEININNLTIEDKISIEYQQDNFKIFSLNIGFNEFLINKGDKEGNIKSIFYDLEGKEINNIQTSKVYPTLYSTPNKRGFYYLFKNAIEIHNLNY